MRGFLFDGFCIERGPFGIGKSTTDGKTSARKADGFATFLFELFLLKISDGPLRHKNRRVLGLARCKIHRISTLLTNGDRKWFYR